MTSDPTSEMGYFHFICCGLSQNTWIQLWISEFGVKCQRYHTCTLGRKTLCDNISHDLGATLHPNPKNHGSKYEQVLSSQNVLPLIYCKSVISHFLTVKEAERRNWISPGNRGGGRNERKKTKTRITALHCLQLILPPLHTKTFDGFQWHSPALPVTPPHSGLDKLTQYGSTHSQAHLALATLLVAQHEICP